MVAVLVSGGIDSLMAARLLKKSDPDVFGIYLKMGYNELPAEDIREISDRADIPVETIDCRSAFQTSVIDYFIDAYRRGQTPNPCLFCNPQIKFGLGLRYALDRGADFLASGHYCRIGQTDQGPRLIKGADKRKDQSYFLSLLTEAQLSRIRFPLADMTKSAVSAMAAEAGLSPVTAKESQDVCFIDKDETYADFIRRLTGISPRPGKIENIRGEVIGEHNGVHLFTVGQRRGINCPAEQPYYVARIDVDRNRIIVGFKSDLFVSECRVRAVNWIGETPTTERSCKVKVRYQHAPAAASVSPLPDDSVRVLFDNPQFGVAPGQGAVFYQDEVVLGGGIIDG